MSVDFSIEAKLAIHYSKPAIEQILKRGLTHNLQYHDHILAEKYFDAPLLSYTRAAEKVMKALEDEKEDGPGVFFSRSHDKDFNGFFWFYKAPDGFLECIIGGFGILKRKEYPLWRDDLIDTFSDIDIKYYLEFLLDITQDFYLENIVITKL
jgi:hypothetical protein